GADIHRRSRELLSRIVLDAVADQPREGRVVQALVDGIAVEDGFERLPRRSLEGSVEDEIDGRKLRLALRLLRGVAAPTLDDRLRGRGVRPEQRQDRCCDYDRGAHGPHGPTAGCFHRSPSGAARITTRRFVSRWIGKRITARRPPGAGTRRSRSGAPRSDPRPRRGRRRAGSGGFSVGSWGNGAPRPPAR